MVKWAGLCLFSLLKVAEGQGVIRKKNSLPEALCGGVPCAGFFQAVKICANETDGQGKNGAAKKFGGNFGGS